MVLKILFLLLLTKSISSCVVGTDSPSPMRVDAVLKMRTVLIKHTGFTLLGISLLGSFCSGITADAGLAFTWRQHLVHFFSKGFQVLHLLIQ